MIIHPEIITTPDLPTIKFREPKDKVDLDVELPRILHSQGWSCGTYFHIQFISHDRTKLLSSATFVVSEEVESVHTSEANPYNPVTRTVFSRKASRVSDWWGTVVIKKEGDAKVVWNPGLKVHQVKVGEETIFETKDKEEALRVAHA